MDKWNVWPLKDVNGIKFGMKREEVRKVLGGEVSEFKKSKFSKTTTDNFGICHVFYNMNDECEAVEIFEGVTVDVNGKTIFPTDIESIKKVFGDIEEEYGSFISKSNSIGIYAPSGKMESILFGNKGYYED